ncbi:MAG: YqcI/YcgG family protein [Proteobacteria bacterium]|nr:MAG: YqcI/YcgG family protein [Pseudomonadota bacterium]
MQTENFSRFIRDAAHPCAMAKSALSLGNIQFGELGALGSDEAAEANCRALYRSLEVAPQTGYWSFVAQFPADRIDSEEAFEARLWTHLQRMHDFDAWSHDWDSTVSSDPADAKFSFSIGGRAWYVIGLHPQASRVARRLDQVALVFNPHGQFDDLRVRGKYTTVRDQIRNRDQRLQGSVNPMLADHGQASEARQYSGRAVETDWRCPFQSAH